MNNKSVTSWRGQKSVVSVVSWRFPNSITTTCCQLVGRVANKSVTSWQVPRRRGSYGETCVMDFGQNVMRGIVSSPLTCLVNPEDTQQSRRLDLNFSVISFLPTVVASSHSYRADTQADNETYGRRPVRHLSP